MKISSRLTVFIIIVIASVMVGSTAAVLYSNYNTVRTQQKPVLGLDDKHQTINQNTQVVLEKEYGRCKHVIISEFNDKQQLVGKSLKDLQAIYTASNGYKLSLRDGTLVIHQVIDDWCPADKDKCRLKEYRGNIAIYKGPDSKNDVLLRVTRITLASLPQEVKQAVLDGKYEFAGENAINDALENLDEFL